MDNYSLTASSLSAPELSSALALPLPLLEGAARLLLPEEAARGLSMSTGLSAVTGLYKPVLQQVL